MFYRCYDRHNPEYHNYGGRGIRVCKAWKMQGRGVGFRNFLEDMGVRPKGLTLDRINNNKGYSKENCRWVTMKVNANNSRAPHFITIDGERNHVRSWAAKIGVAQCVLYNLARYHKVSLRQLIIKKLSDPSRPKWAHMWRRK